MLVSGANLSVAEAQRMLFDYELALADGSSKAHGVAPDRLNCEIPAGMPSSYAHCIQATAPAGGTRWRAAARRSPPTDEACHLTSTKVKVLRSAAQAGQPTWCTHHWCSTTSGVL